MSRWQIYIMALLLVWTCKKNSDQDKAKDPKDKKDNQSIVDEGDEKVDIPNNIAGSYLACAILKEATEVDPAAEYGCRLSDSKSNNKIDLQNQPSRLVWSSNIDQGVSIVLSDASSPYHAFYRIKGSSAEDSRAITSDLEVVASWRLTAKILVPVKRDKIGNVLRPNVELETYQVPTDRPQVITPD